MGKHIGSAGQWTRSSFMPVIMRPSGKGVSETGLLPPPEGVDVSGLRQIDSHSSTLAKRARKTRARAFAGGRRGEQETIVREARRSTLVVPDKLVRQASAGVIVYNEGDMKKNILIGHPTLGSIRYEWHVHRMGQIVPINWQSGQIASNHLPDPIAAGVIGYHTADAQNVIAWHAVKNSFEWLLLWEDDVLPPFDAMIILDKYTHSAKFPVVSGLYFSKGVPSWPLIFRGRGNGAFLNFRIGDRVMVDGVPTGFLLVHMSVIRWLWDNSPEVQMPDGTTVRQVFKFPRDAWFDPEQDRYFSRMGTSDLYFCFRVMKERILEKTGWSKHARANPRWPFLVDTSIFCRQIDLNGRVYPDFVDAVWPRGSTRGKPFSPWAKLKPPVAKKDQGAGGVHEPELVKKKAQL